MWIEEYKCGCSISAKRKRDLIGYCSKHGESWRNRHNTQATNKSLKK